MSSLEWEPGLQIVLLGSRQVQRARNDGDDLIRDLKRLVELFRGGDHGLEHLPRFLRLRYAELFDFLELVDTEDSPHISARGTRFFTETGRVSCVFDWELFFGTFEPFVRVECGYGLFRGCDQVLLVLADHLGGVQPFAK